MSDEAASPGEQTWRRTCEYCGHELVSVVMDVFPGGDEQLDVPVATDHCPNPACPAKAAENPEMS